MPSYPPPTHKYKHKKRKEANEKGREGHTEGIVEEEVGQGEMTDDNRSPEPQTQS